MKVLGLIPARGGSKGIPNKNIKLLNSRPLIAYTIDSIKESKLLSRVVLSTDDEQIAKVGRSLEVDVPFLRPSDLATDSTPTLPAIQHCLSYLEENEGESFDAVCLLQVTSPFRAHGLIDRAIEKFVTSGADALISVLPVPHEYNPEWVFFKEGENNLKISTGRDNIIPRRQDLPDAYIRDGAIYITRTNILKERNSLYGDKVTYIVSDPNFHVNLDTMEDWEYAERLVKDWK